jgi:hypothetical protein
MLRNLLTHIGLSLLFSGTVCVAVFASTLTVGKPNTSCPNAQYTSITAAVNAAAAGDVIAICPATYPEQLIITMPLTLQGVSTDVNGNDVNRVLLQPVLQNVNGLTVQAVITVMNTGGVTIENLAIDASNNTATGCNPSLADVHYFNASGVVTNNALFGAKLAHQNCGEIFPNNGFGVLVDSSRPGPFRVSVEHNSIRDFTQGGVQATNTGVLVDVEGNRVSGVGPPIPYQFGISLSEGAAGQIKGNFITLGSCRKLSYTACLQVGSVGITLGQIVDGSVVDGNVISDAQSGIEISGNNFRVTNNLISNIDLFDGIDIGLVTNSLIDGNTVFNVTPLSNESCGVYEISGAGIIGNTISNTTVNDAYCGVLYVTGDQVGPGNYYNTLYTTLNGDLLQSGFPPPSEP